MKQNLKLYLFTVQKGTLQINVAEDTQIVMADNDDDAFSQVRAKYTLGEPIIINARSQIEIRNIIQAAKKVDKDIAKKVVEKTPTMKKKDFLNGLLLVTDKFVVEPRDRATLKRIINKIVT